MTELKMEYNFGWQLGRNRSKMTIYLDKLFVESEKGKLLHVTHTRKVIKHILKYGSDENIDQVSDYLKQHSSLWFKEFEKMKSKK